MISIPFNELTMVGIAVVMIVPSIAVINVATKTAMVTNFTLVRM